MSDRCPKPEELTDVTAGHPQRPHVDECPRCQAVLKSYASFLDPGEIPEGADLKDADARLAEALNREIGKESRGGKVVTPGPGFWTPFRVRTVAAVAAVVIVAVGLTLVQPGSEIVSPADGPVLRGAGEETAPFTCQVIPLAEGGFRVVWPAVADATEYRVVVFDAELEELISHDAEAALTLDLPGVTGAAFCRVVALRNGDEVALSSPGYLIEP